MSADGTLLARLSKAGRLDEEDWKEFHALDADGRKVVIEEVKARLDALVRSAPNDAPGLADRLVELAERAREHRALGWRARAVASHALGHFERAVTDYRKAIELHEHEGDRLEAARARRSLVDALQMSGSASEALAEAALAAPVFAELGEDRLAAQLDSNVGNVWFRLDRYEEARICYERAVDAFEQAVDPLGRAFALYNLGNVETNGNRFDEARRCFDEAERVFAETDHRVLAADCRYGAAYLLFRRGRYAEAQSALQSCAIVYEEVGKPSGPALCRMDLAELHLRLDAWRDARTEARLAADAFLELGMDYERARSRLFLGVAQAALGEVGAAESALTEAQQIFDSLGNGTLGALARLHRAALGVPDASSAIASARKALRDSGDRFLADVGSLAWARHALERGRHEEALEVLRELTRAGGRPLRQPVVELEAWEQLSELYEELDRREDSEHALERAIEVGDEVVARLSQGDARLAFRRDHHPARLRLALSRLDRGTGASLAIREIEEGRRRALQQVDSRRFPDTASLRELRARLDALLCRAVDGARLSATGVPRSSTLLENELGEAQDAILDHLRSAGKRPGAAEEPRGGPDPFAGVPEGDALLYFALDERRAHLIHGVPSEGRLSSAPLDATSEELSLLAARLRFQIDKLGLGADYAGRHSARIDRSIRALLGELGERLLAPARATLDGRPATIVPYGVLHELPLHALILDGRPLVARCDVVHARSLSQLARAATPRQVAGPWLGGFSPEPDLPAIDAERSAISAGLQDAGQRLEVVPPDRLLDRLRAGPPIRALHLASHGMHQADHPLFSGLRMGERFLAAYDLRSLSLECEVVTLSGCETGRATRSRSDLLHGPEQAFLAAGARSVVSTLWPVIDRQIAAVMGDVYGWMARGASVRSAVSRVLREAAEAGEPAVVWGAPVLSGDPGAAPGGARRTESPGAETT